MVAQMRFCEILYFAMCLPLRLLTGKTHLLFNCPVGAAKANQWCTKTMDNVDDHLLGEIKKIIAVPSLFLSEHFIMNIFSPFMAEMPSFKEYIETSFDKQMLVVDKSTELRINHMKAASDEWFKPQRDTNIECTPSSRKECLAGAMKCLMRRKELFIICLFPKIWFLEILL